MELNFRPVVYMRDRTHTYLWLRDENGKGVFLTMESGVIEVVKLNLADEAYHVIHADVHWQLTPHPYDPILAFKKYHDSLLVKSEQATEELAAILSLEPGPKPTKKVVEKLANPTTFNKAKKERISGGYSLAELCKELGIDPSEARKALRNKKVEKPSGKWEWPNREAAEAVRKALK